MITYRSQRHYSNSRYITLRCVPSSDVVLTCSPPAPQFTAKSLNRQAKKTQKDENAEKARLKKVRGLFLMSLPLPPPSVKEERLGPCILTYYLQALQQGNTDGARIYAANAIRKKSESLNLLRLSSRIDAVASRVETATTMRQVTGNMTSVVKGMDKAMETMNLERVRALHHITTKMAEPLICPHACTDLTSDG